MLNVEKNEENVVIVKKSMPADHDAIDIVFIVCVLLTKMCYLTKATNVSFRKSNNNKSISNWFLLKL